MELKKEDLEIMMKTAAETAVAEVKEADGATEAENTKAVIAETIQEIMKGFAVDRPDFFDKNPRDDGQGGFKDIGQFCHDIYLSGQDFCNVGKIPRMSEWLTKADNIEKAVQDPSQNLTSLTAGSALVPPTFSTQKLDIARGKSTIMNTAMVVPMATDVLNIPVLNNFDKSQGLSSGNVKFRFVSENEQDTANQVKFKMVQLVLREATASVAASKRLMDVSPVSIIPFIDRAIDDAIDTLLADKFINGTGAGQPLGVMNKANLLITTSAETNQAANTIYTKNLTKMFARHWGTKGEWYANKTTFPDLATLTLDVGTGGSVTGLLKDRSVTGEPSQTIFGHNIVWSEYMQTLGTKGDIGLFDWTQYLIGQLAGKGGLITERSPHLKFDFRQEVFQFIMYIDGQPWYPEDVKPRRGDSQSPFGVIETRS